MPKLDSPTGLGLTDPETGRESTSLEITFNLVTDATSYELSLDGVAWPLPVLPGSLISPLSPNTQYAMSVIARANGFDDSNPSPLVQVVTRPPTPSTMSRAPIDLNGWGIVLDWSEPGGWNGAAQALVLLRRADDGGPPATIAREGLGGRYIDTRYPLNGTKEYDILIATLNPLDGTENLSRPGPPLSARGPIQVAVIGTVGTPLVASQKKSDRLARALLGLSH